MRLHLEWWNGLVVVVDVVTIATRVIVFGRSDIGGSIGASQLRRIDRCGIWAVVYGRNAWRGSIRHHKVGTFHHNG